MKPAKKNNCPTKKSSGDNFSTPKIDSYFKAVAKQLNVEVDAQTETDEGDLKAIYIDALKEKLRGFTGETNTGAVLIEENVDQVDHNEECAGASSLPVHKVDQQNDDHSQECKECKQWECKYNDLKKLCLKLTIRNADMDFKYEDLLKTKTIQRKSSDNETAPTDDVFTKREVKFLECMALDKKIDSTFVHHCLQYAYKDDLAVLRRKTLKGTAEVLKISDGGDVEHISEGKSPLTPEKIARIRGMFIERISKCQIDAVEYEQRIKDSYMNKLVASSIRNIVKKK